jgi:hypothetical protein
MKSLFEKDSYQEIIQRINKLTPATTRQWGKMEVAQMLAHCSEAFHVPLSDKKMPRMFMGILLAWMMKHKMYNDSPWKRNLPTAPNFIIRDKRDFDAEKQKLTDLVGKFFTAGPDNVGKFPHPFFGTFTKEQWGKCMYKHLDHHLTQFGV